MLRLNAELYQIINTTELQDTPQIKNTVRCLTTLFLSTAYEIAHANVTKRMYWCSRGSKCARVIFQPLATSTTTSAGIASAKTWLRIVAFTTSFRAVPTRSWSVDWVTHVSVA